MASSASFNSTKMGLLKESKSSSSIALLAVTEIRVEIILPFIDWSLILFFFASGCDLLVLMKREYERVIFFYRRLRVRLFRHWIRTKHPLRPFLHELRPSRHGYLCSLPFWFFSFKTRDDSLPSGEPRRSPSVFKENARNVIQSLSISRKIPGIQSQITNRVRKETS